MKQSRKQILEQILFDKDSIKHVESDDDFIYVLTSQLGGQAGSLLPRNKLEGFYKEANGILRPIQRFTLEDDVVEHENLPFNKAPVNLAFVDSNEPLYVGQPNNRLISMPIYYEEGTESLGVLYEDFKDIVSGSIIEGDIDEEATYLIVRDDTAYSVRVPNDVYDNFEIRNLRTEKSHEINFKTIKSTPFFYKGRLCFYDPDTENLVDIESSDKITLPFDKETVGFYGWGGGLKSEDSFSPNRMVLKVIKSGSIVLDAGEEMGSDYPLMTAKRLDALVDIRTGKNVGIRTYWKGDNSPGAVRAERISDGENIYFRVLSQSLVSFMDWQNTVDDAPEMSLNGLSKVISREGEYFYSPNSRVFIKKFPNDNCQAMEFANNFTTHKIEGRDLFRKYSGVTRLNNLDALFFNRDVEGNLFTSYPYSHVLNKSNPVVVRSFSKDELSVRDYDNIMRLYKNEK